jgi:hypothetical protein
MRRFFGFWIIRFPKNKGTIIRYEIIIGDKRNRIIANVVDSKVEAMAKTITTK